MRTAAGEYAHVVATRDHHIDPGAHFAEQPDYLDTWPPHCVVGTDGVEPAPRTWTTGRSRRCSTRASTRRPTRASRGASDGVPLADWLRERGVDAVDVVGITTDYCVRATALDAVGHGFSTRVLLPLTAGVSEASTEAALDQLRTAGVELQGAVGRA